MNGQFSTREDAIRYHLAEGFRVGDSRCRSCFAVWTVFIHSDTTATKLQCPKCGHVGNWFTATTKLPK